MRYQFSNLNSVGLNMNYHRDIQTGKRIVTSNICPPIPMRECDWQAWFDGEEELGHYGSGSSEREAIADLLDNC